MAWFVVLANQAGNQGTPLVASVVGPMSAQEFTQRFNETAVQSGPNENEFATKALADAAAAAYNHLPTASRSVSSPATNAPAGTTQGVGFNGVSDPIAEIGAVLKAFFGQLTKLSMWRSLAWIVVGLALFVAGIGWWVRGQVTGAVTKNVLKGSAGETLDSPVIPLAMILTGAYLAWFGIAYWEDTSVKWPSDPLKSILTNKGLPGQNQDVTAVAILTSAESQAAQAQNTQLNSAIPANNKGSSATVPPGVPSGSAQKIASSLLHTHGWGAGQMAPLIALWTQESGWSATARNKSSGAFGIAQALGHGTSGSAAPDGTNEYGGYGLSDAQARAANAGSAYWQIVWGLNYIAAVYPGGPSEAEAHERSHNWY